MFSSHATQSVDDGRGGQIRTADLHVPNVARYQTALRPDFYAIISTSASRTLRANQAALRPDSDIIGGFNLYCKLVRELDEVLRSDN